MGFGSCFDSPFVDCNGGPLRSAPPHFFPRGLDPVAVRIRRERTSICKKAKPRYGYLLHDGPHVSKNLRRHTLHESFKNSLRFFTREGYRLKPRDALYL